MDIYRWWYLLWYLQVPLLLVYSWFINYNYITTFGNWQWVEISSHCHNLKWIKLKGLHGFSAATPAYSHRAGVIDCRCEAQLQIEDQKIWHKKHSHCLLWTVYHTVSLHFSVFIILPHQRWLTDEQQHKQPWSTGRLYHTLYSVYLATELFVGRRAIPS